LQQKVKKAGWGRKQIAGIAVMAGIARNRKAKASETHANLGGLGMDQCKRFGILVEAWGEGTEIAGIAVIARNPKGKP
jgi:hypothetical protein